MPNNGSSVGCSKHRAVAFVFITSKTCFCYESRDKRKLWEGEKPGVVLTPTFGFADQKLEEMSNMDKLIWRLGPLFYKNLSGIILATEKLL